MTREEILKLEAGPQLDRIIAERVMGWEYDLLRDAWFKDGEGEIWAENWHPSTDIKAAWEVLLRIMATFDYNVSITSHTSIDPRTGERNVLWEVILRPYGAGTWVTAYGPNSLLLAICRAALLAVMEAGNAK